MAAYYNEFDPYAAQWLRNLIAAGHIAAGEVDERSICDVDSADLAGFTQCHFFAGIGVWSHALRLAGWPDDQPVWTGSCPCQPFSAAGKRGGFDDERHLWPELFRLVRERRPAVVFGEQVASKDGLQWLDAVQADLEGADYASAAVDLCAAGVGAPHIRQRLYWVADAECRSSERHRLAVGAAPRGSEGEVRSRPQRVWNDVGDGIDAGRMANNNNKGLEGRREPERERGPERAAGSSGVVGGLADPSNERCEWHSGNGREAQRGVEHSGDAGGLADAEHDGCCGSESHQTEQDRDKPNVRVSDGGHPAPQEQPAARPTNSHWRDADWLFCRDGKWRPVEPGTFPLAHGATARVGRLRAYGNAIVPQVAQAFIEAFMECRP